MILYLCILLCVYFQVVTDAKLQHELHILDRVRID